MLVKLKDVISTLGKDGIIAQNSKKTLKKLGPLTDPKKYEGDLNELRHIQKYNIKMKKVYTMHILQEKEYYEHKLSIKDETIMSNNYLKKQVEDILERKERLKTELDVTTTELKKFRQNNDLLVQDIKQT